ncbi:MAG TPA: phosphotransferase family protein [Acidimicrobiia bacterium]|jgi:aminoglycoside phosphotransferase (APT) family kinase protein
MGQSDLVDVDRLTAWLDEQGIETGAPTAVTRITTGHSNEVFLVERGAREMVLRRPPRTPLSPTAHDMAREFRLLSAFRDHAALVPVPRPIALCTDVAVIGAPFYVMTRVDGVVIRDRVPRELAADPAMGTDLAHMLVDLLAAIHGFAWQDAGLADFGRPDGYLDRQVPRWLGQLERYKTRELPEVDQVGAWLGAHTPRMQSATVIHGDYKLDNVMVAATPPATAIAVLDWEQATIGDPLVDVGWLLGLWLDPEDEVGAAFGGANLSLIPLGCTATRAELAQRYASATGRDVSHLDFYCALALFKLACVMEGSYARFKAGTSDDAFFAILEQGVPALARRALEFT